MPSKAVAIPLVCLALAACARSETPQEAREAAQAAQAEYDRLAAESGDPEEDIVAATSPGQINTGGPLTPGEWSVATVDGERVARFGEQGQPPILTIGCELGGGIDIRLPGIAPQGGSSTVNISTPEGASTFTASDTIDDEPQTYISVPASDPFITRLMSGNGPYSLRMGETRLSIPAGDAVTSLVSGCDRRDAVATTTDAEAAASGAEADGEE